MDYLTIICDIIDSKQLEDREGVQYQLIDMLKEANDKFSSLIAAPFIITVGDEWQGLLYHPCDYSSIISFFQRRIAPVTFRCGMGIGEIAIHDYELTVNQLDGPAFYKARKAINMAKQFNYSLVLIQ